MSDEPTPVFPVISNPDFSTPMTIDETHDWAAQVYERVKSAVAEATRVGNDGALVALQSHLQAEIENITYHNMTRLPFAHSAPDAAAPLTPHHTSDFEGVTSRHEHFEVTVVRGLLLGWYDIAKRAVNPNSDRRMLLQELRGRVDHHILTNKAK